MNEQTNLIPGFEEGRTAAHQFLHTVYDSSWIYREPFTFTPADLQRFDQAQASVQHEAVQLSNSLRHGQYPQEILERYFPETGEPTREFQSGMRQGLMEWSHQHNHTLIEQRQQLLHAVEQPMCVSPGEREIHEVEYDMGISW